MKGVFDTQPLTKYDDDISRRYHFPNQYLSEARRTAKDWIIYREPRRGGGRLAYVAVAQVSRIEPDRFKPGHSYAYVSNYLEFDAVVPLRNGRKYYEDRLNAVTNPSNIGVALQGRSVRTISEQEFAEIVLAGFSATLHNDNPHRLEYAGSDANLILESFKEATPDQQQHRVAQMLVNRTFRDSAFRRSVVTAYKETCAVTGLRMINGGGKAEVQAAHIRAVNDDGPDIVQNGIALSATCHWLFDRYLISLRNDYSLLVAHNRIPSEFQNLFSNQLKRIHLPDDEQLWPKLTYLERHRDRFLGS